MGSHHNTQGKIKSLSVSEQYITTNQHTDQSMQLGASRFFPLLSLQELKFPLSLTCNFSSLA